MNEELDKIFEDFNARKDTEKAREEEKRASREAVRDAARSTTEHAIVPVLQEIAVELKKRGAESSCKYPDKFDNAELTFKVNPVEPHTYISESSITFALPYDKEGIEVRLDIQGPHGKGSESGTRHPLQPLDQVTDEWVRAQVHSFVERVLKVQ